MNRFHVLPLDASTWDLFAELVERSNGIYGGCWCIGYHPERGQRGINYREVKEERVKSGRAHHALMVDEDGFAQGWCQWGDTVEAISEVTEGRQAQGRFLFSGTVELLEDYGFRRVRQVGKHAWIVSKHVAPG